VVPALRDGALEVFSIKFVGSDGRGVDPPPGVWFGENAGGMSINAGDEELANMALR